MSEAQSGKKRVTWHVPPGATVRMVQGEAAALSMMLWLDWAVIARKAAEDATLFEHSDEVIDDLSAALAGLQRRDVTPPAQPAAGGLTEHQHAMIAVAAAAHAIDGFYGSIKPLLFLAPPKGKTSTVAPNSRGAEGWLCNRALSAPLARRTRLPL
jgi:hypothetical protein